MATKPLPAAKNPDTGELSETKAYPARGKTTPAQLKAGFQPPIRRDFHPKLTARSEFANPLPEPKLVDTKAVVPVLPAAETGWEPREIRFSAIHAMALVATILLGLIFAFLYGQSLGRDEVARTPARSADLEKKPALLPGKALPALDAALALLRDGKNTEALDALKQLITDFPDAPSVHYAAAIAALQSGYPVEAEKMADLAIMGTSRASDALALKAAISATQSGKPTDSQEVLLREAIAADPMNPNPFLELASLMRYRGKSAEARQLLESAALRMNPADSRTVLDTTLALMSVEPSEPPPEGIPTGMPEKDFPAALAELRSGNYEVAATILRSTRQALPPDLFAYLINDPSLRKFSDRPELAGLY